MAALAALMLTLLVGECAPDAPVSRDEMVAIHDGRSAVILLRIVGTTQRGEPLKPLPEVHQFDRDREKSGGVRVGGMTFPPPPPASLDYRILSEEGQMDGWVAFIRPPGYYYLDFLVLRGKGEAPQREQGEPQLLAWRIEVPPGEAVIYAGTFRLSGSALGPGCCGRDDLLIWIGYTTAQVEDESRDAALMARRDLPSLPQPLTRLAVLHSGPKMRGVPAPVQ
jgi:hypothetical protein